MENLLKFSTIAFVILFTNTNAYSQFDFRLGSGLSLSGTGDVIVFNYESELNYKANKYFTFSSSFNLGQRKGPDYYTAALTLRQGNFLMFLSPFKNSNRNDFRIGGGISFCQFNQVDVGSRIWVGEEIVGTTYNHNVRSSFGYNIIIENTYQITERFLVGAKLFTQPFYSGDINSGWMIKVGLKI